MHLYEMDEQDEIGSDVETKHTKDSWEHSVALVLEAHNNNTLLACERKLNPYSVKGAYERRN